MHTTANESYSAVSLQGRASNKLTSYLNAIVHQVIGQCLGLSQVCTILPGLLLVWSSEGVMQRLVPLLIFIPLKHGEVCDPQQSMLVGVGQLQLLGNELAYSIQAPVDCSFRSRGKQQQITLQRIQPLSHVGGP